MQVARLIYLLTLTGQKNHQELNQVVKESDYKITRNSILYQLTTAAENSAAANSEPSTVQLYEQV